MSFSAFRTPKDEDAVEPIVLHPARRGQCRRMTAWGRPRRGVPKTSPSCADVLERSHPLMFSRRGLRTERLTPRERTALRRDDITSLLLAPGAGARRAQAGTAGPVLDGPLLTRRRRSSSRPSSCWPRRPPPRWTTRAFTVIWSRLQAELTAQLAAAQTARDFVQRILQNVQAAVLVLSVLDAGEDLDHPECQCARRRHAGPRARA